MHEVLTKSIETFKTLRLFQFLRWSSCRTSWSGRPPALTWPWSVLRRRTLGPSTTGCTRGACSCPPPSTPWLPTSTATGPGCASPSTTSPRETSATTGVSPRTLWGRPRDPSGCTVRSVYNFSHTVLLLTESIVITNIAFEFYGGNISFGLPRPQKCLYFCSPSSSVLTTVPFFSKLTPNM